MEQLYSICHIEKATMFLPQRDSTMVFLHFFPSLLRGLKKRGVFPTIFQFCLPAADRNPFLARDPQEKQGTLWSGVPSLQIFVPSSLSSSFLDFLAQFLFSCLPPIRSTPERSSFRYPRGPLLVFLRIIYFLSELFPESSCAPRKLNHNNCKMRNNSLCFLIRKVLNENNKRI